MRVRSHQTWLRLLQRDVCLCPARRARLATRPRFYSSENTNAAIPAPASQDAILTDTITTNDQLHLTPEARKRIPGLVRAGFREYPRIKTHHQLISAKDFHATYEGLKKGGLINNTIVTVHGRLSAMRESGSKLVFLDVDQVVKVQGVCHLSKCIKEGEDPEEFKQSLKLLRRGDVIGMTGYPIRTPAGELSVFLTELPTLLSPCLHPLPTQLLDEQTRIQHRHVDLLVHKKAADTLRLRSSIVNWLRQMFRGYGSHEVHTPIMSGFAGGAVARPFQTTATEFGEDRKLELRVAPELWLKRLILGGMDRVFELGPCFRNEGIDQTHNPEFTVCEAYQAFLDLEGLISMTEDILLRLFKKYERIQRAGMINLPPCEISFERPYPRLEFIPALEAGLQRSLPYLSSPSPVEAEKSLIQIFEEKNLPLPSSPTLPRLLDRLSSIYIEPQCINPTFIMFHPECLSPLSKSFVDPRSNQRVSARMELFVKGRELINAYEEENSPFEQRRKFLEGLKYREDGCGIEGDGSGSGGAEGDGLRLRLSPNHESYLQALEWGLPPTGGWGCGIDRLVMLFAGTKRIGDVLSFGTMRNVVGLEKSSSFL